MMSVLRLLYVVCWRNRLLIPLIISCATFAMVVTMFYHGSSEEPNIARQVSLAQRHSHKLQPRAPLKNLHRATGEDENASPHAEPIAESIQAVEDSNKVQLPKKGRKHDMKELGSNIPDADELKEKLSMQISKNRKKDQHGDVGKQPGKNRGDERVINPEHGKFDVGKKKRPRNHPNIESNKIPLRENPRVDGKELRFPGNKLKSSEKQGHIKDNGDNQQLPYGDNFKVAKEKGSTKVYYVNPQHDFRGNQKANNMPKQNNSLPGQSNKLSKETGDLVENKLPSLREISEKHSFLRNNSHTPLNGSLRMNSSIVNMKPVVFKPGMPISSHKHKNKVVNFDIKPPRSPKKYSPHHRRELYRNRSTYLPDHLGDWLHDEEQFCDSRMKAYHGEFAYLKNIVLDRNFAEGNKGGETIQSVINQPEEDEYYQYMYGFFQFPCAKKPDYFFNNNNHINQWLFATRTTNIDESSPVDMLDPRFTIAVVRYEYVNIYHSMTDFYNAFLMMEFFNKTQTETNILVIDGHPKGTLDGVWDVLFNSSQRISQLPKRTKFTNLVWGMLGYNSPLMDHYAFKLPMVDEFRKFFLSSYRVNDSHKLSCDHLTITFLWRRDYVAHPRNPTGTVSRKIANEEELVLALHEKYPNYTIQGMQIDLFDMHDQLQTIAHTDILIGMHGAGLTHALFLPSHGGLVELLPVYWAAANEHFEAIARWRKLLYQRWVNVDSQYEVREHVTKIPPDVLTGMVTSVISDMCGRVPHRVYPGFGNNTS